MPSVYPYRFAGLLAVVFLLRGVAIQCLYPPLEGPDEYQHIAVIEYIVEHRAWPVYGEARVPPSMYEDIVKNPHPTHSWEQTRPIGALRYQHFYDGKPRTTGAQPIALYQAQHPPLYYVAVAPLYTWLKNRLGFRPAVYLLRGVNLVLAALALILLLYPLRRILADDPLYRLYALAIALSPMFMIYVSRVSNDALALAFAGAAVVLILRLAESPRVFVAAFFAGLCAGWAVLSKLTGLVLLPASLAYLAVLCVSGAVSWRRGLPCGAVFLGGYLLVSLPYHIWAWSQYGTVLPAQETIINAAAGRSFMDIVREVRVSHSSTFFFRRLVTENLWTSGWSFLGPPNILVRLYVLILACSGVGAAAWVIRRVRNGMVSLYALVFCVLLVLSTMGAAYMHALNSILAHGFIATPSYYGMIAYPAFLTCLLVAALGYGRRIAGGIALALLALFMITEVYSLFFIAAPHWAHARDWATIMTRLASIHPAFPTPWLFFVLYPLAGILALGSIGRIILEMTRQNAIVVDHST